MIHDADAGKVLESGQPLPSMLLRNSRYLSRLGVPPKVLDALVADVSREAVMSRRLAAVEPLCEGDTFRCKHVTLEVLSMPGHTPGLCCLYDREHRLLFSADHLLERVSPNPLIELKTDGEPAPFRPLVAYFRSMERLRALPIDLVLPGHAAPFREPGAVILSLYDFYERRQARLLSVIENRPRTVYEAMAELFTPDKSFELFLMLSETLGNLEVLEEKGWIVRETEADVFRFRLAR
jgi:glyoxylase-like metal-dependent hydrolase (beta-lactamase superfamily II)